eukprot:GEZU01014807.1.p2 GENE.GEZU01014807.1~~GEZU01014807.1.p2  ORF type:complete len:115 (-),score=21.03 GEZU01014807.1:67-411(-)
MISPSPLRQRIRHLLSRIDKEVRPVDAFSVLYWTAVIGAGGYWIVDRFYMRKRREREQQELQELMQKEQQEYEALQQRYAQMQQQIQQHMMSEEVRQVEDAAPNQHQHQANRTR